MDIPTEKITALFAIVGVASWACLGTWIWIIMRKMANLPILPVAWRKPVPWRGVDVLFFAFIYISSTMVVHIGKDALFPPHETAEREVATAEREIAVAEEIANDEKPVADETGTPENTTATEEPAAKEPAAKERGHAVAMALKSDDPWTIGLCFFMAVIFAPLSEEFIFRMFLQGYLEKVDWRFRVQRKRNRLLFPHAHPSIPTQIEPRSSFFQRTSWGVLPIVATAGIFAMLHFRLAQEAPPTEQIRSSMITIMVAGSLSLTILFLWLRLVRHARLSDFGLVPREIPRDILRGLLAFFAIAPSIYVIQMLATIVVPEAFAPDPIPIFVLAVALGTVWCRTHRIVPSIIMHMSLNGTSMGLAWYLLR